MKNKKFLAFFPALIFLLLFFFWGTRGKFWNIFTAFYPRFHIIFLVLAVLFFLLDGFAKDKPAKIFDFFVEKRYFIFPFLGFLFPALIAVFVFDSIPHVIDASHFLWTARVFIETGHFHLPESELYEYYQSTFNVHINDRYFSLFLPGFSIFLVPFELLGISQFFTPLCNGISVFLLGKIADRQFDAKTSFFAMFFALFSSFYLFMGASYMTHPFNLMLTLLAIYLVMVSENRAGLLVAAGFAGAWTLFIRPQNAFFVYGGILILMFSKKMKFKSAVLFTLPFIFIGFLLMFYNWFYTGNPMLFPQDVYFFIREPYKFCHRMGFGKGCPNTEGDFLPAEGLTPKYAFWISFARLTLLNFNLVGHPLIFVFLIASFFYSFRKSLEMSMFFLIFFVGYFFFYLSGNLFGPRYFSEVASLLLIPCGYAFFSMRDSANKWVKPFVTALPAAIFLFLVTTILPPFLVNFSDSFWSTDREIEHAIERENISNSIVFVPPLYGSVFLNLMKKPPYDDRGNLILLDLGEENFYAAAYFMDKKPFDGAYLVDYYPKLTDKTVITPLFEATRGKMIFEFENKRLPKTGEPDYGVNFSMSEEENKKFYPIKELSVFVSNEAVFAIRFDELTEKSYYDFTHPVIEEGEYEFNLFYVADKCGTDATLFIDGENVGTFASKSPFQERRVFSINHFFSRGNHVFKIVPKSGNSCLMLDSVEAEIIE
ncbi:glycosyltransferase family 39 protein [bacterium]|nr:glycosyltransferase family 39 protein [bacterium]